MEVRIAEKGGDGAGIVVEGCAGDMQRDDRVSMQAAEAQITSPFPSKMLRTLASAAVLALAAAQPPGPSTWYGECLRCAVVVLLRNPP
jgi:hypothetical protein